MVHKSVISNEAETSSLQFEHGECAPRDYLETRAMNLPRQQEIQTFASLTSVNRDSLLVERDHL